MSRSDKLSLPQLLDFRPGPFCLNWSPRLLFAGTEEADLPGNGSIPSIHHHLPLHVSLPHPEPEFCIQNLIWRPRTMKAPNCIGRDLITVSVLSPPRSASAQFWLTPLLRSGRLRLCLHSPAAHVPNTAHIKSNPQRFGSASK